MTDEEKKAIEYLKARLYGNEGCKIIDVAQSDLRIFLNLVENQQKDIENWKKYCNEQENDITVKNNKICDLEFEIEKQQKEIELLKEENEKYKNPPFFDEDKYTENDKIKAKIEELKAIADNGANAIRFAMTHDDAIERIQKQKDIRTMVEILQLLLEKE